MRYSTNSLSLFQGFCIDMLQQISEQVGFNYVIELVPDNNYGAKNTTTQEWNGLVRGKVESGFSKIHWK